MRFSIAFILNCLVFSLVHSANPNSTIWSFFGVILIHFYEIFGFLNTGNLWLIFGIHAGWNFSLVFFGFTVSGWSGHQVIEQVNTMPAWFGGGAFGPEAGAVVLLTTLLAYTMITLYTKGTRRASSNPDGPMEVGA